MFEVKQSTFYGDWETSVMDLGIHPTLETETMPLRHGYINIQYACVLASMYTVQCSVLCSVPCEKLYGVQECEEGMANAYCIRAVSNRGAVSNIRTGL